MTNDELKNYDDVEVKRKERSDLDKYDLTEEEKAIVNNVRKVTQKDMFELEKNELTQLNNITRKDEEDNNIRDEENEIINEIISRWINRRRKK